jgi:hypothetical protein
MVNLNKDQKPLPQDAAIVSKAMIRAASELNITNVELSNIIGISQPQLSRIANSTTFIKKDSKDYELALLFIRVFRSLDALVGGDAASAASWIRHNNLAFGQVPIERLKKVQGLLDVLSYLDSRRAVI